MEVQPAWLGQVQGEMTEVKPTELSCELICRGYFHKGRYNCGQLTAMDILLNFYI